MSRLVRHLRDRRDAGQAGFTLVEMMIAMFILLIVSSIATSVFVGIQKSLRKQTGYSDAATASRIIFEDLDKQVRYANAITAPGTDAAGNQYVEWQTGDTGATQTCHQWRVTTAGVIQQRAWTITTPLSTTASPSSPTWTDVAGGVVVGAGVTPVFTSPVPVVSGSGTASAQQQLGVTFDIVNGNPAGRASTNTVFTAANSPGVAIGASGAPAASVVCTQVPRSN